MFSTRTSSHGYGYYNDNKYKHLLTRTKSTVTTESRAAGSC